MKLGNGSKKYKFIFAYLDSNQSAMKYVYADTEEEAYKLFNDKYKGYNIAVKSIEEVTNDK